MELWATSGRAFEVERVRKLLERENLSREEALRLVELIDSNYIAVDREAVEEAVGVLLVHEIKELLEYEPWIKKAEAIRKAIDDYYSDMLKYPESLNELVKKNTLEEYRRTRLLLKKIGY